jgi:4-amino-4-deoxy-L-arabinose transferase-like glycosyltransferase
VRVRPAVVVAILIAASAAIRVAYFSQLDHSPFIQLDRWAQTDMHYYDGWARQIASGDWTSTRVPLPMHRWHREIAQQYLASHADLRTALEREAAAAPGGGDAQERLWTRWMRAPRFYQDPLYPYLVAAIYRVAGADPRHAIVGQLAIGVLTNVLIWWIARRFFGDAAGVCAAGLAILCAPLLFYEALLLRDSLIAFTGLALVCLADRAMATRAPWRWFVLGLALGAACLLKSSFLLLAIALGAGVAAACRHEPRGWRAAIAGSGVGVLVALTPLVLRNVAVGAPAVSLAASGPMTFVAANEVRYLPDTGFGIDAPVLVDFLGSSDGGWRAAAVHAFHGHTVASYSALLWRKWDRAWHWFEIPNNENFYYLQMRAPILAWLPVTFSIVGPLALIGLALGARRIDGAWPLYALVATTLASLVIFYVLGRFRVALTAALIPFAALTIAEVLRRVRERRLISALGTVAAVLIAAAWIDRPLAADQLLVRTADWILPYSVEYQDRVYGALDRKAYAEAGASYLEFFARYQPATNEILSSADPRLAPELADMHMECAGILTAAGEPALAQAQQEEARRILLLAPPR